MAERVNIEHDDRYRSRPHARVDLTHVHTILTTSVGSYPVPDWLAALLGTRLGATSEVRVAEQTILHDADRPSHILLPVIPARTR